MLDAYDVYNVYQDDAFTNDNTYSNLDDRAVGGILDPLTDQVAAIVRSLFPNVDHIHTEAQIRAFAGQEADSRDNALKADYIARDTALQSDYMAKINALDTKTANSMSALDTKLTNTLNTYEVQNNQAMQTLNTNFLNSLDGYQNQVNQKFIDTNTDMTNFVESRVNQLEIILSPRIQEIKDRAAYDFNFSLQYIQDQGNFLQEDCDNKFNKIKDCLNSNSMLNCNLS